MSVTESVETTSRIMPTPLPPESLPPLPGRGQRWLVATTEYAGLTAYTGGIGRHYAALLPALVRQGVAVDLLVLSDGPSLPNADLAGVRLVGFVTTQRIPGSLIFGARALRVRFALARHRYDRVFLPEWDALGALLPRHTPLLTNLATSVRLSNEISGLTPDNLPASRRRMVQVQDRMETRQIRHSAGLIAISRAMSDWTEHEFDRLPPMRVVRNCIDVDQVAAAALTAPLPSGWPEDDGPIVLFLGRLERRKGVPEAVHAFAKVVQRHPTARLVLAGSTGDHRYEPNARDLLDVVPEPFRSRVTFLGHVASDSLYRGIRQATVTMCPSRWEGFGNVALEVHAIGTPLICTTGSGYDDFCVDGQNALMVPPRNAGALADAVCRLIDNPGLRMLLARTAEKGVHHFSPDAVAPDLIATADEMLGPVRSPR